MIYITETYKKEAILNDHQRREPRGCAPFELKIVVTTVHVIFMKIGHETLAWQRLTSEPVDSSVYATHFKKHCPGKTCDVCLQCEKKHTLR